MAQANFVAGGTIQPARFVTFQPGNVTNTVVQATGNAQPLAGISAYWSKLAPIPNQTSEAADSGDQIVVFQTNETTFLNIASGQTVTAGDRLTSDVNGDGVTATTTQHWGAVALETLNASAGSAFCRVQVFQFMVNV